MTDVRELIRRLGKGESARAIAHALGISRNTVRRYGAWAAAEGLLGEGIPVESELRCRLEKTSARASSPRHEESRTEPFREMVAQLVSQGVEAKAIWQLLAERHGFAGSYSSVRRFVRRLRQDKAPQAVLRVEVAPGEEAQVDFGYAGYLLDPERQEPRRAWVFVMTLSHSRHQYAELVFDQSVATWTRLHVSAFEFFGGTPRRLVLDNLKAGIVRASLHDPEIQRSYRDLCEHYDVLASPCRPRTPQHKGKVEKGGVHYVKRNGLAGRVFRDLHEGNEHLRRWCLEVAGRRTHGTTQRTPLDVFERSEREALRPLPASRWELCEWKRAKLSRDCHVTFHRSYYSAPHRLVGRYLMVRATAQQIQLFHEHELVATHERASQAGSWKTHPDHLPPDKVLYLVQRPDWCRHRASEIGPQTSRFVELLLGDRPVDRLKSAQAVLRLSERYGETRLEAACRRALAFGELQYTTVERILRGRLDRLPLPQTRAGSASTARPRHARSWTEFFVNERRA